MTSIANKPISTPREAPSLPRVLVLLAGGTAPSPLSRALGCSLLDVPVTPGMSVLRWWCERDWGLPDRPREVRIARGSGSPAPTDPADASDLRVAQFVDQAGPRGSAGALRDATANDSPDTTIISVESSCALLAPLDPLIAGHAASGADATLVCTRGGRLAGVTILNRGVLDAAKSRGYVDLKEQLLPALVRDGHRVAVLSVSEHDVVAIHERQGLLTALGRMRQALGIARPLPPAESVVDPRWHPSVVADETHVHPRSLLSGSLVMHGGRVGAGAVLVRSIVTAGAAVPAGRVVLDTIVSPDRWYSDEQLPREARKERR